MAKPIGPTFVEEISAAGLAGLPFAWGDDGSLELSQLTPEQRAAVLAVYEAHDPEAGQTLDAAKAAATEEVRAASERVRARYYPTGKEIDIRRLAPGFTQAHLDELNAFLDGTLNLVANQAATEIETAPDLATLQGVMAEYRAMYGQELA